MLTTKSFFELNTFSHPELFAQGYVWDTLKQLKSYISDHAINSITNLPQNTPLPETVILHNEEILSMEGLHIEFGDATKGNLIVTQNNKKLEGASVIMAGSVLCGSPIQIGKGVLIEAGALIKAPAIIGDCTEVRQGAYLRGHCVTGERCVVGHVTEVKHSIFLDDAKAGHFAYLGDSILGNNVNLGAGTKLANLRFTKGNVPIRCPQEGMISTGLRKIGAILADQTQTGCNSVTNPGTLLGKRSMVMPNTTVPSGFHPPSTLVRG